MGLYVSGLCVHFPLKVGCWMRRVLQLLKGGDSETSAVTPEKNTAVAIFPCTVRPSTIIVGRAGPN